jgi:adenine-specific DNA-methyltransferase
MARGKCRNGGSAHPKKRAIDKYEHTDKKRTNNPPVGLVTPETDPLLPTHKIYDYIQPVPTVKPGKDLDYDPHLDPQLVWAGKKEHTSFEVPTVSLHVHETIDPRTIIEAVRKRNGNGLPVQPSLFERPEEKLPLRDAIDFYKHPHGWSNRLIAGDSLLVMNSLLEKEGMAGQVQMVYLDPPYGIKYGSNFQPFVNKRDVKDGRDEDLTQEPEMIRAFRDTWELGIHSYLTYLRDRLLLARELLSESGSCFIQISDENLQFIRNLMDDVFLAKNFVGLIAFTKTTGFSGRTLSSIADYLVWYARDAEKIKYRQLFREKQAGDEGATKYRAISTIKAVPTNRFDASRLATSADLTSQGASQDSEQEFRFAESNWRPPAGLHWKTTVQGLEKLGLATRIIVEGNSLRYIRFFDDFPVFPISNIWSDIGGIQSRTEGKIYVVQTATLAVERCVLITTDPGDLILDPTCGSGTTAYVAEQWGRRWITFDTSRVATTVAKQRLMTAEFNYYELAHRKRAWVAASAIKPSRTLRSNPSLITPRFAKE